MNVIISRARCQRINARPATAGLNEILNPIDVKSNKVLLAEDKYRENKEPLVVDREDLYRHDSLALIN